MSKLDDLHTLVRLLNEFELPVSPILEYAIKERENALCSKDIDDVKIETNDNQEPHKEVVFEPLSSLSPKDSFSNYLFSKKSVSTAHYYLRYIDKPIRAYIKKIVDPNADSIYSFKTVAEIRECVMKLKADEAFMADNIRWHNSLTAALASYQKFIESKENA